jgi:hypothetical protein
VPQPRIVQMVERQLEPAEAGPRLA